ncbi:MAG: GGDEF domain-containing response regulator [Myxococcales bacterium]|nr:GGDEF domain-containing response regulator [Myxococcales bacterium]MCB9543271.1 GGDEF domain-containing response regulator [Myxococcales bacterium]
MDDFTLVILVEDDPQDAIVVRRFLGRARRRRFSVVHVSHLSKLPETLAVSVPDVILLDLTLPDARGLDSLRAAIAHAPDIPIIVLTGVEDEALGLRAMESGAQDYLVKGDCDARSLERAILYAIERKRLLRAAEHTALHDALTGLPNRTLLLDRLGMAIERSRRAGTPLCVALFDLDDFRLVNDELGPVAGDQLLAAVAHRLHETIGGPDTVARLSADTFACLFELHPDTAETEARLDALLAAVNRPHRLHTADAPAGRLVELRCSAGLSVYPEDAETAEGLLSTAGHALRRAKEAGGGCLVRFGHVEWTLPPGVPPPSKPGPDPS